MEWDFFDHKVAKEEYISSEEDSNCYYDFVPQFVEENGYLPVECRECYKALIFWNYSEGNVSKFNKMVNYLPISINGKFNESVVVFYFKNKVKMIGFLEKLKDYMKQYDVDGRIQWRVSGKYWQNDYPDYFESAKELKLVNVYKQITMVEWLGKKGILS